LLRFLTKALIVRKDQTPKKRPQKEGGVRGKPQERPSSQCRAKLQRKPRS
jgi:hypothetical protein